jgi:GNAT superfamily N-acetyltransferase
MTWSILQRWFNIPPWENAEYVTGSHGEKLWIVWPKDEEDIAKLRIIYRGRFIGHVTVEEKRPRLIIWDINVLKPYRKRGVGKAMLREIIQWASENRFQRIWGNIKPDEYTTLTYLKEWYARQGFKVYETKSDVYHITLELK